MKEMAKIFPAATLLIAAASGNALASGFQLSEQSGSGLGNAFAGAAAVAEDASTIYFNPAGLTALPGGKQVVVALHAIDPSAKFRDSASQSAGGIKAGPAPDTFTFSGLGGDAGSTAYVPNAYFAMSIDPRWSAGIGFNAPFGLKTEYEDGWIGRFQGIKSELATLNVNPTVAYKLNDDVSLGFGLDYQQIDATLTKALNYTAVLVSALGPGAAAPFGNVEGRNELKGSDSAWGYNLGAMFRVSERTRLGVAYRSAIKYHLTGTQTATHPTPGGLATLVIAGYANTQNQDISLDIKMPDTFSLSAVHRLDDRWDMLGDLSWTGWAKIPEIRVKFTAPGAIDDVTNWKLRNTLRASVGANYRYSDALKLRFGIAYDESPVTDQYRTVRLPDNNRTWLAVGAQYKPSKESTLDAGFAYLWVRDTSIDNNGGLAAVPPFGYPRGLVNGSYDNSVRILSVQYSHDF